MTLGILNINSCVTSKLQIIKNKLPCDNGISCIFLLYIVYKHQCNLFTMCSLIVSSLFTVTGNNNTMYSRNRIGNRNCHFKLPIIVFQINSISLIDSEEFRETSIITLSIILRLITVYLSQDRMSRSHIFGENKAKVQRGGSWIIDKPCSNIFKDLMLICQ